MATKPRWDLEDAKRRARVAAHLAERHGAQLTPRLEAGLLDQLAADRIFLGDASDARPLTAQKVATATEREIAADAHDLVMTIRNVVARSGSANAALRTAIGIGDGLRKDDTKGVLAALKAIETHAESLRAVGVHSDDVAEAAALAASLRAADDAQSTSMNARADSTEARVAAHLRLEAAVDSISSKGALAFRKDPLVRARFERLVADGGPQADDDRGGPGPLDPPVPA